MADDLYSRRNSYNTQTRNRDVYSYEYLSRPFSLTQDELPQLNTNQTQTQTGLGGYLNGQQKNSNAYGALALTAAASLNASSPNNKYQNKGDQEISNMGNSVSSAIGPWWGALTQAGEYTSKELKGDGTNQARSVAGTVSDPWNAFKGNRKEDNFYQDGNKKDSIYDIGGNSTLGNFAINNLTGKNVWDAVLGKTAKEQRNYQKRIDTMNMYNKVGAADQANAMAAYKLPKYQALPYGEKGMKIRTKLTNC